MSKVKVPGEFLFKFEAGEIEVQGTRQKAMVLHINERSGITRHYALPVSVLADWLNIQQNVAKQLGVALAPEPAKPN